MNKKKKTEMHRMNKSALIEYTTLVVILLGAYILEFVKKDRTLGYTLIFAAIDVIPYILFVAMYIKNRESKLLKYIFSISFSVLYTYVLLTAAVPTTFVYVFMLFVAIIPYGDMILCYITGGVAVVANIVSIVLGFMNKSLTTDDLAMVEIQLAAIILGAVFVGFATYTIGKINAQKLEEINDEKKKTEKLLANTLDLSKSISEDIKMVTEQMEILKNSVVATRDSMDGVSCGTSESAESLQKQLIQTEEIVSQLENANNVTRTITGDVDETHNNILIGKENIENLLESVSQSELTSQTVAERMEELIDNTEKMNEIVEMINSITNQTRLLSFNASIEAARAGEAGRGFSVVATEISSLAGQTNDATINITELISSITASIKEVYESINQLMDNNKAQNGAVNIMADTFEKIEKNVEDINRVSDDLEKLMAELSVTNESMVSNINNVSAITEEVSASANETLSESEKNAQIVEDVTNVILKLNEKAKNLDK